MKFELRKALFSVALIGALLPGLSGCSEDCDRAYQKCVSQIDGSVAQYSYDETCKYPSMNRGVEKAFCECENKLEKCLQ